MFICEPAPIHHGYLVVGSYGIRPYYICICLVMHSLFMRLTKVALLQVDGPLCLMYIFTSNKAAIFIQTIVVVY